MNLKSRLMDFIQKTNKRAGNGGRGKVILK